MAPTPCRECGRWILNRDAACPHCGAPLPVVAPRDPEAEWLRRLGWAVAAAAVLAVVGAVTVRAFIAGPDAQRSFVDPPATALSVCQDTARDRRAPEHGAAPPGAAFAVTRAAGGLAMGGGTPVVRSRVDVPNGPGGRGGRGYDCRATREEPSSRGRADSIAVP